MRTSAAAFALVLAGCATGTAARAEGMCATPDQARQVRDFYQQNPGTMPVIAARKLNLPEVIVASGLPPDQVAGVTGAAFTEVWAEMTRWKVAVFLIMKGENVFEILSPIGAATPSKTSKYTNIAYEHPLRGHLRPDLYASIYAVALPTKDGGKARGVLFYDGSGASVFGAFMSGEALDPSADEIATFDELMKFVENRPQVCPGL